MDFEETIKEICTKANRVVEIELNQDVTDIDRLIFIASTYRRAHEGLTECIGQIRLLNELKEINKKS